MASLADLISFGLIHTGASLAYGAHRGNLIAPGRIAWATDAQCSCDLFDRPEDWLRALGWQAPAGDDAMDIDEDIPNEEKSERSAWDLVVLLPHGLPLSFLSSQLDALKRCSVPPPISPFMSSSSSKVEHRQNRLDLIILRDPGFDSAKRCEDPNCSICQDGQVLGEEPWFEFCLRTLRTFPIAPGKHHSLEVEILPRIEAHLHLLADKMALSAIGSHWRDAIERTLHKHTDFFEQPHAPGEQLGWALRHDYHSRLAALT